MNDFVITPLKVERGPPFGVHKKVLRRLHKMGELNVRNSGGSWRGSPGALPAACE
jgi:hypothetical protein